MSLAVDRQQGPALTAWLAGAPEAARDGALRATLVAELLALLQPHGVRSIWTSESRTYRASPRGQALVRVGVAAGRIITVVMAAEPGRTARDASGYADFAAKHQPIPFVQAGARIASPHAMEDTVVGPLVGFVQRWVERLRAGAAFVSTHPEDHFGQTRYESMRLHGAVCSWAAACRFARGVFWGMFLGPDLCRELGGMERVQAEAPVAEARRLGEGVWLQLSPAPPPSEEALQRLEAYLQPLLGWTRGDLARLGQPQPTRGEGGWGWGGTPPLSQARPKESRQQRARPRVPVRYLRGSDGNPDVDTGLHVHLGAPPSAAEREALWRLVGDWYAAGIQGAFGGAGFHDLVGTSEEATVLHWHIDLGSADGRRAIRDLAARLKALPGPTVERLEVGTQRVG